jgi:hypothetical protein
MNENERLQARLVGVWRLVSYTDEQEGHEDSFPIGPEPEGFLIYTPDGFVSAQLMKPGRPLFRGVYQVDEDSQTVTHIPSVALAG